MTAELRVECQFPAPIDDDDIDRLAHALRADCGRDAAAIALKHAEDLLALGDAAGCTAWIKIAAAIEDAIAGEGSAAVSKTLPHRTIMQTTQRMAAGFLFSLAVAAGGVGSICWRMARLAARKPNFPPG